MLQYQSDQKILDNPKIEIDLQKISLYFDSRGLSFWEPFILKKIALLGTFSADKKYFQAFSGYLKINSEIDLIEHLIRLIGFDFLIADDYVAPVYYNEKIITQAKNTDSKKTADQQSRVDNNNENSNEVAEKVSKNSQDRVWSGYINSKKYKNLIAIRKFLAKIGFIETVTRPFVEESRLLLGPAKAIKLINPNSSLKPYFRDNIISSQLEVISNGLQKGYKNQPIFEVARVYRLADGSTQIHELTSDYQVGLIAFDLEPYFWTSLIQQYLQNLSQDSNLGLENMNISKAENQFGSGYLYSLAELNNSEFPVSDSAETMVDFLLLEINNKTKKKMGLPIQKKLWSLTVMLKKSLDLEFRDTLRYKDASNYPKIKRSYSLQTDMLWKELKQKVSEIELNGIQIQINPIEKQDQKTVFEVIFSSNRNLSKEEILDWENKLFEITN